MGHNIEWNLASAVTAMKHYHASMLLIEHGSACLQNNVARVVKWLEDKPSLPTLTHKPYVHNLNQLATTW